MDINFKANVAILPINASSISVNICINNFIRILSYLSISVLKVICFVNRLYFTYARADADKVFCVSALEAIRSYNTS